MEFSTRFTYLIEGMYEVGLYAVLVCVCLSLIAECFPLEITFTNSSIMYHTPIMLANESA
jgi:hypothetical protein